ncbi:MAG TPA: DUF2336 domain-containing protein [Xanthobacteraceae bacterium]|nr:DUF2336 domain-containing protein [Xanthobacteraceae bacterium]
MFSRKTIVKVHQFGRLTTPENATESVFTLQPLSLIDELEAAVRDGSADSRVQTLRRITDLFLHDANRFNDEQITVFDDVLCLLVDKLERTALEELGKRLAPVDTAPIKLIKRLARDDEIAVAAPVLTNSKRLSTTDLIAIARTKGQAHLLAISERAILESQLTDVLVGRGDGKVVFTLAKNAGATFSQRGFDRLVEKADGDDRLAEIVGLRKDLPSNLLQELLRRAGDAVLKKILLLVPPERREEIERAIAKVGKLISKSVEHNYDHAERRIAALASAGKLDESALLAFVQKREKDELVVALARMSSTPIGTVAHLLGGHRNDAILFPCKAAGLSWATVELILRDRLAGRPAFDEIIKLARRDYAKLTMATAQRTLRFTSVRAATQ